MDIKKLLNLLNLISKKYNISQPYCCGGVARDLYMNSLDKIHDIDITTGDSDVNTLANEFNNSLLTRFNTKLINMNDGHVSIILSNIKVDFSSHFISKSLQNSNYTSLQKEMYSRDFTCNSLLASLDLNNIIDITSKGKEDIDNKILKTCLDPSITISDDPKRIPRILYLASKLNFEIDNDLIYYIKNNNNLFDLCEKEYIIKKIKKAYNFNSKLTIYNIKRLGLYNNIKNYVGAL